MYDLTKNWSDTRECGQRHRQAGDGVRVPRVGVEPAVPRSRSESWRRCSLGHDRCEHGCRRRLRCLAWDWIPRLPAVRGRLQFHDYPNTAATSTDPPLRLQASDSITSTATDPTNGFFPKNAQISFKDVTDGLSNTVAVFESGGRPFVYRQEHVRRHESDCPLAQRRWLVPCGDGHSCSRDRTPRGQPVPGVFFNRTNGDDTGGTQLSRSRSTARKARRQPFGFHAGGQNVLFGDGSVKFVSDQVDIGIISAAVTRNGAGGIDDGTNGGTPNDGMIEPRSSRNRSSIKARFSSKRPRRFAGNHKTSKSRGCRQFLIFIPFQN